MFFATTAPAALRRPAYAPVGRSFERFLNDAVQNSRSQGAKFSQDEGSFTLSFDLPGVARDQLSISIEANIVRIESKEGAPRQYKAAYELPQDIDASTSEAKLDLGVLTIKLAKKAVVSNTTELPIN